MLRSSPSTIFWTSAALAAFASNSILCRFALGRELIDPWSFTVIRIVSGAVALWLISIARHNGSDFRSGSWQSAIALLAYAVPFSVAYLHLTAGTGALILFGSVQLTMIGSDMVRGKHPHWMEWIGLLVALSGLAYLVAPGITSPDPISAVLMGCAGISWGIYSIRGKGVAAPLAATSANFARATLIVAPMFFVSAGAGSASSEGILLAVISGAAASGAGYAVWYTALRGLTSTRAGIVQLFVPLIAAAGGVAFLGEPATPRLLISGTVISGGVALTILRPKD